MAQSSFVEGAGAPCQDRRVQTLISALGLQPLLGESGYLAEVGESPSRMEAANLPIQSHVYYMLTRDKPINYLHRLECDDTHILIEGGPVMYHIFTPGHPPKRVAVGRDVQNGQTPMIFVPAGSWKALVLDDAAPYALLANVLTPAWAPDRVKIGESRRWVEQWADQAPWATTQFLEELIGPNVLE